MDRSAMLTAVAEAASAAALGRDDAAAQRRLDGKRFEVRIRFGCASGAIAQGSEPAPAQAAPFTVRFNEQDRTLRVRAAPDLTLDDRRIAALAGERIEAVEGFWMRKPWLLTPGCPVSPAAPPDESRETEESEESARSKTADDPPVQERVAAEPGQRVGLAQFFTATDPRTGRRDGRAYEATKVLDADEQLSRQGYDLVLSGRLRRLEGGRVIACTVASSEAPPDCVVSAEFDRVRIEAPGAKKIIAEWRN